jgi:hypothetical protein
MGVWSYLQQYLCCTVDIINGPVTSLYHIMYTFNLILIFTLFQCFCSSCFPLTQTKVFPFHAMFSQITYIFLVLCIKFKCWNDFICHKINLCYFLSFPLLLHGTEPILYWVWEITQIKNVKSIILESSRTLPNDLFQGEV